MTLVFSTLLPRLPSTLPRRSLIRSQGIQVTGLFRLLPLARSTRHTTVGSQYRVPESRLDSNKSQSLVSAFSFVSIFLSISPRLSLFVVARSICCRKYRVSRSSRCEHSFRFERNNKRANALPPSEGIVRVHRNSTQTIENEFEQNETGKNCEGD